MCNDQADKYMKWSNTFCKRFILSLGMAKFTQLYLQAENSVIGH